MSNDIKPIRRVVTGHDAQGRSCVLYDRAAPNVDTAEVRLGGRGHGRAARYQSRVKQPLREALHRNDLRARRQVLTAERAIVEIEIGV